MTIDGGDLYAALDTAKDGEFRCERCRARCSRSPNDRTEYGHHTGCPDRPDNLPRDGKYLSHCDHAPGQQVITDGASR